LVTEPLNQILLTVEKKFQDELITDSGIKLYLDGTFEKNWNAAVTATVSQLPIKYSKQDKKTLDQINVGDEVAMSYMVVADLEFKGDGDRFQPTTEENPYLQEYANGKGEWIRCYALPVRKGIAKAIWVGAYTDKTGRLIDGCQGTESELARWKSQFQFGKTDIYNHCNLFSYNKQDYWKADPNQIFAKKINGHVVAVGNRVICKPIEEKVPDEVKKSLMYKDDVKIRYQDRGRVISSNKEGIKKDYVVGFQPNHVEKYQLWGQDYFLINEKYVNGIWSKN
jgi:hypothetical protein